ncbi:MAG TPA: DUF2332 domain-containing protein [Acetobacteraceae bacterium]|nr:DUF2332 domain-containing protein [Acetobacteraceae bacterium]
MSDRIAARFRRFAQMEADGRSPLYASLARGVAADAAALAFLARLPGVKQQPNLLFAAVRHLCGTPRDWAHFRALLRDNAEAVQALMLARRTQTNEPARCATLLPVLARLQQPLALLEVGASAGLCLLPDHYAYRYGTHHVAPVSPMPAPLFACNTHGEVPLPDAAPCVVWRAGLDLDPIDLDNTDDVAWLETLVWPEQVNRLDRLRMAISVARAARPPVMKGDLLIDLPELAAQAPRDATLVVFHSAVITYVADQSARDRFAATVRGLGAVWICNESPTAFPQISAGVSVDQAPGRFLLAVDGRPVAWTDPHGASIEWLG